MRRIVRVLELMYSRSRILPLPGLEKSELTSTEEISDMLHLGVEETRELLKQHQMQSGRPLFYYVPPEGWCMTEHGMLWFELNRVEIVKDMRDADG